MTDEIEVIATLAQCEAVIERGRATFMEVGGALETIKAAKLYLETHKTFEEYCRDRWDFGSNYANKVIRAKRHQDALPKTGTTGTQKADSAKSVFGGYKTERAARTELASAKADSPEPEAEIAPSPKVTDADVKSGLSDARSVIVILSSEDFDAARLRSMADGHNEVGFWIAHLVKATVRSNGKALPTGTASKPRTVPAPALNGHRHSPASTLAGGLVAVCKCKAERRGGVWVEAK